MNRYWYLAIVVMSVLVGFVVIRNKIDSTPDQEVGKTQSVDVQKEAKDVPWDEAVGFIETCSVSMIFQSHDLTVDLTLTDGTRVSTIEPRIDAVFTVVENARSACGDIIVATE